MKKGKVICKFILVILLLLSMLPIFVTNTAVAVDLEGQDNTTQSDKVKFKAYFTSSTGTETHSMVADINGQRPEINYQINVEEGRLENPVIKVTDENGTLDNNFMMPIKLSGTSQVIDRIDAENKTIYFRQITDGYITGSFPLSIDATADFDLKKMNQNSKITLTGTYYGDDGSVVSINKSIYVNLGWEANFNIHVAQRISKYIPYNRNGERGITIQIAVRTRLDTATKPYPLPVKKTTVTMQIPTFNGINPTKYAVAAVSTAATNGRDGTVGNEVIFSNANCSADLENHTITIQVENTPENNVVASSLGTDEYLITFDYPASAYDSIMETGNAFLCKTTSTMEVYSNTSTKTFTNTAEDNYTLKEIVGADSEGALEKAIFYRNSIKQESGVEQGYNFNVSLEIQELGTINSLRIEEHDQEFVDAEGNRYSTNVDGVNYIYTNMFAMSKQNFEMIFGTEGYVQVYDKKGTLLGTINKNSPLDENGFYYINLPEKTGPVVSITSKPIVISGTYTYIAHRDISPDMPYTKAEISTFQNLAEGFTNTSRKDGESDYTGGGSAEAMLPLVEPLSQSTISISKQSLEVGKVNENVILTITVKNGAPAKFEWYARPIFDIELPEYITDVEINASRMLYTNDLSIKNVEVIKRNGKNYLRVTVDGESTNLYTKDTTIEINTNLTVDPMTPTVAKDINMYYYNESSVHYYNEVPWALEGIPEDGVNGIDTIQVGFIADPELISVSEISNYESTGKVVNSLEETNNTGKIENNNQDTTANMTLKILNNTFAECTNPVILGRIPTQGNKAPVSGEDLGSTFTTLLAGNITAVAGIEPSQMTIYYSENADATKDIAEPSNGWTTTPSDLKTIKSYLIVTNDFTLPAGEMLQFTYPFTVPANQSYLSTSYGTFGVYYNQNNTAESGKVGLVIPEGEKYTFLLTKTDENSGTIIQNVTFNLNGRGLSVTKYKTNALGQIRIAGLYPNEIYTLSEEPLEGYQVEEGNQIQFKLISESGTWKLQVLKGSFNGEAQITPGSNEQEAVVSVGLTNEKITYQITTEAGEGGTISGSDQNPYETVRHGENSVKDIVITPNPNYEIKAIYVNDEPIEIPEAGENGVVTLDKFTNVTKNINVRVEFQKIVAGGVTVKYIDKATGEEILQQKTQSGYVGDSYSFTREEIASYEAEEPEPTNSTGYLTKDPIEVIFYYKKVEPAITGHSITKTGPEKITSDTDAVSYTIQYQVNVNQYIGEATVTIVDTLPYALDEGKVNQLDGGNYDAGQKTITWVETIENFDTYQTGAKTITFTKNVTLYYKDINYGAENVQNQVSGKLSLKTPTKEDTVKGQVTTPIEITTSVEAVKTWVDNENADGNRPEAIYLQVKNDQGLVQEQKVTGDDWRYTFTGLPKYNADGSVITYTVDEREENPGDLKLYDKQISGNTITNTYKLSNTNIKEPAIDKTGTSTITSKDEQLEYTITYNATIENYIGTGTVTIVDTLPYAIDESKPYDLAGGEYNKQAKTITWVESLGNIDTFQEGAKQVNISKTIQLSYENINVEEGRLVNNVSGKIDLDATKDSDTQTDTFETTENFVTSVEAVKTWVDNEDADGNRPESIYLQVKNGDEMVEEVLVTGPDWKHTFTNLPKYSSDGTPITYTVDEREETAGDLKLYDKQISGNTITNTYKLTNTTIQTPSIDKTGTTEITSKEDQVQYTLTYTATVENYIGTGRVTIVDTLPYEIDETKEYDLAGGSYNKEAKTITWVEELGEVDTFNQGAKQINISKTIRLSYENINVQEASLINNVSGKIDLDATKDTDTKTDTFETTQNFVTSVEAVKTWVDNENADGNRPESIYLQVKNGAEMVEEALVTGPDWKYTFTNLPKYEEDGNIITYTVDEREAETGDLKLYTKQIEGNTITNTYKLTNQSIQNPTIDKTGTAEITSKDQALTYTIAYTATVDNYIGTGRVTIVDTLPYELDESKPNNLQEGEYNKEAKTITWVEELGDIDTFSNEAEEISITKTITVYYQNINVEEGTLVNNVSGKIDLDTTKETDTKEDTFTTTENFVTSVEAVKTWEDNENADGNRPTAIYLQVKNGEQVVQEQKVTGPDWKYTFNNLPKYSSDGNSITYTVDEREETPGDLTLYNKQISGNTITNTYKLSNTNIKEPTIDKTGTSTITSKDEQLEYTITYNATIENYIGTGRVTIVDTLPYAIDESKPYELDGGNYNKEAKTITWVEDLGDIDTFQGEVKEINISKTIQLSYENINVTEGSFSNKVSGKIELDTTKDTNTTEDTFETTENFVTSVEAVKTWVDNDNADGNRPKAIYLQVKNGNEVVQESLVTEKEGWKHTFTNLPKYGEDGNSITYTVDEREQTSGDLSLYDKQIKGNTITNTYKLTDTSIQDPSIQKMGTLEITSKDQALDYIISYTATVNNYIGTGRVTIVDTLPYELDESKPNNLDGGIYNKEAKTITWVEELGDIDTFQGEAKEINITKNIKVYYQNISVQEDKLINKVSGKIDLDTTKETNTQEDTLETKQNFVTEVEVVKTWVDEENADGNRPDVIYLQVKNGDQVVQEQKVTGPDWKYTFTGLPKYSSEGSTITYTVDEREETPGDLALYNKQISGNTITNTYKLSSTNIKEPSIEKTGTTEITSKDEQVEYTITYHATVENYVGTGTVTIVDTLPYAIDETKPYDLAGGTYNKEAKTITWVENLGDIDTFQGEAKEINIRKTIQLSYENINVEEGSLNNKVSGTIYLDTTKDTDTKEDTFETTENFVTEVEVVKTWEDEENADGNRPDAIYLQVKNGDEVVRESLVTEKEGWKHTFTGLPKYQADGSIITYTVDEREETAGDLELYDKQISGNTITNTYKLTDSSIKNPSIEKTGTTEITNQQQAITYTIHYTANIENYIGTGRVTIVDTLPYAIDESKPNDLAGGNYDKQTKTITWVEELGEMDTFAGQTKEINISKTITVYYQNISPAEGKIVNQVTGKVELDTTKETNTKQDTWETTKNFLTEVEVVKTWVDNENADGNRPESIYLQVKNGNEVVQESLVTEKEGWKHTFTGLPQFTKEGNPITYTVDERASEDGKLEYYRKQIQGNTIINTYQLGDHSIVDPTIEKTGPEKITQEDQDITYHIQYQVGIKDYIGNAQVTIVDTLPYELDETKENKLDGGTYDAKTKTITWTQTIENIDTYQKESMLVSITKNIEVYYKEIKEEDASFVNTAEATITLETTKETQTVTDKTETSKNFTTELQVSKIWEDNNNQDGNRPEAIYLQVKDGNTVVQEQKVDETNDWKYTFTGLPKYHTDGSIINYTIDEKEVKKGDLTFYQKSINGNVITNTYTLNKESIQNPKIEKEGPAEITEVTDAITYTITYQANVTNYQGSGTLTIVDTLPYPLDETKQNNLAGGTYDKETQTITWVEELSNINAIGDNVQTITWNKAIQVYYSITDDTVTSIRNTVKGTIFLENGEQTDTQEDTQTVVTKQDGSILVHYYLEGTTQKIAEDVVIVGKVGETYQTTEAKDIDSKYELVTVPDNKEGTIGENSQTVIYYYRIKTYEITTEAGEGGSITGSEEKPFEVVNHGEDSQKEIIIIPSTGYKVSNVYINDVPVDFTVREDGTVTLEQIKNVTENKKVVAVFEKIPAGGITIHYVDKETGEELLPTEQIEGGYVGETYVVKRKDIPYYNPVLPEPENSKGRLTEGNIDVTFYYQKQVFDITVDKWIQSVTVDGETKAENTYASKGEIVKRDVHAKKTNQTTIEVSYCIRVSNTGEIAGTVGKVIESIPEGMYWNPKENPGWIQDEVTGYIINDSLAEETLNPGEYKELEFVLHWKQGEANIGEQINQVFIQDVNNEAQYPDSKPNNDTAQAELLIAISPGIFENNITYIVIAILVLSTAVVIIVHYRTKTKQR